MTLDPVPIVLRDSDTVEKAPSGSVPVAVYGALSDAAVGPQGPEGPRGLQGSPGPEGPQGPKGERGEQGIQGAQGEIGPSGGSGGEGAQGPRGERGADGTSIVIDGYVDAVEDLPDLSGNPAGPSYIVMSTGHIFFWNGTSFTDGGNVTGPRGADGEPGEQGPRGADGAQGIQGPPGERGPKGDPGEQGIQGIQGEQGPVGLQGIPGTDGTNGQGVPAGGTAGQMLVKTSGTDYATEWVNRTLPISEVGGTEVFTGSNGVTASREIGLLGDIRLRTRSSDGIPTLEMSSGISSTFSVDFGSIGYRGATPVGPVGRSGNNVTLSTTSWTELNRGDYGTFMIRNRFSAEVWEGAFLSAHAPGNTYSYRLRATRIL